MEASHALVLQTREQQYQTDLAQLRETTREQIATALHNKENADDIRTLLAKLKNTSEGVDSIQQQMRATVSDQLLQREARLSEREKVCLFLSLVGCFEVRGGYISCNFPNLGFGDIHRFV